MRFAAFLAYPERYADWAQTLHDHLEKLFRNRRPATIFDQRLDVTPGRSRLDEIQKGLGDSAALILVVGPETLCSPQLNLQWQAVIGTKPVVVAKLIDTPLPDFLAQLVAVDFRAHDDDGYFAGLKQLAAGLDGGGPPRRTVALPDGLTAPKWPDPGIPVDLRKRIVDWLTPFVKKARDRRHLERCLGLDERALELPSPELSASAALVLAAKAGKPAKELTRIVESLCRAFAEDEPDAVSHLEVILDELRALDAPSPTAADPLLTAWWEHVAEEHRRLADHFDERPAELEILEKAWVQVEVRPELDRRATPFSKDLAKDVPAGPMSIDEVLALERGKAPWITGRWLLEGEPGAGKTTLLRHLAGRLATRQRDSRRLPVFVSLPRFFAPRQQLGFPEFLAEGLARRGLHGLAEFLETAGANGRLVVLLDGLDEVPPERRDGFETLLRRLLHDWPECPLVLASRPLGEGDVPAELPKLRLLALEPHRQQEFLEKWFRHGPFDDPESAAADAIRYFERRPSLRELAGNPLYLTLLATLWERGVQAPERRVELYDRIFDLLLKGDYKKNPVRIEAPKTVREALSHLALGMTRDDLPAEPPEDLDDRLREPELEALRQRLFTVERWRGSLRTFLDDVYERTQILGPHDGRSAAWRFWHRTFREALTAERLQALCGARGEDDVLALVAKLDEEGVGRWAEPFALLAGRLGDGADGFVLRLAETNGRLGRRALAAAQGLAPETLREMLRRCENWVERSEIYVRLPEHFETPAACLAFLDELRRETRNGNDLFFLDQAALLTGERWPEAGDAAEALRERIFDHVPPPPEELFQWIETPRDGRVAIWRKIPAGRFLMGSPDDEKDRYDDEGPRHEVVVKSGFRMAAVPVTVAQYAAFEPERVPDEELSSHPVDSVTWYQACAFCRWLSTAFSWARGARLATEEEWEYACRAGTETRYWSGDSEADLERVGWYSKNSDARIHRVGEKPANPWGLYDVHGNVWEWTLTEWDQDAYKNREGGFEIDPAMVEPALAAARGGERVSRGGAYWVSADWARSADRNIGDPGGEFRFLGFRVALPRPRAGG